jgi:putative Holliday junction resolvase
MKLLGIDYGKRKIGLAVSTAGLADPFGVFRFRSQKSVMEKIEDVVVKEQIDRVVVGVSEGKMAEDTRDFGKELEARIKLPVVFQDETLTTKDAQGLAIGAGIKRKKRKRLEDAYSATLILQSYIDSMEAEGATNR